MKREEIVTVSFEQMRDIAEIVHVAMYGRTIYQVNLINARTRMYYNSSSLYFDNKKRLSNLQKKTN